MSTISIHEYDVRTATSDADITNIKAIDDMAFAGHRGISVEELYKVREHGALLILYHVSTGDVVGEAQFLFKPIPEIPHHFEHPIGYCYGIAIRPGFQGKGLGKILMQKVWEIATAHELEEVHLSVRVENERSLRLMFGQGYRIVEYRKDFYGPNKIEGPRLIMSKRTDDMETVWGEKETHLISVPVWGTFDHNVHMDIEKQIRNGRIGTGICREGFIFV